MRENRPYGMDALFSSPAINTGLQDFVTTLGTPPAVAAGDATLASVANGLSLVPANPACFLLGFDSLSNLPNPGDTIEEAGAGTALAVVMATVVTGGSAGGGDATGFMFVKSVSGQAWSDNDVIDNTTQGLSDIATVDASNRAWSTGTAATAGLFGFGNNRFYMALTAAEMSCEHGALRFKDLTATELWEDFEIQFITDRVAGAVAQGVLAAGGNAGTYTFTIPAGPQRALVETGQWIRALGKGNTRKVDTYNSSTGEGLTDLPWSVNIGTAPFITFEDYAPAPLGPSDVEDDAFTLAKFAADYKARMLSVAATAALNATQGQAPTGTISAGSHTVNLIAASTLTGLGDEQVVGRPLLGLTGAVAGILMRVTTYDSDTGAFGVELVTGQSLPVVPLNTDTVQLCL